MQNDPEMKKMMENFQAGEMPADVKNVMQDMEKKIQQDGDISNDDIKSMLKSLGGGQVDDAMIDEMMKVADSFDLSNVGAPTA